MPRRPSPRKGGGRQSASRRSGVDDAVATGWHETLHSPREVEFVIAYVKCAGSLPDAAAKCVMDEADARRVWALPRVRAAIKSRLHEVELDVSVADIVARQLLLDDETPVRERIAIVQSLHRREEAREYVSAFREIGRPAQGLTAEELFALAEHAGHVLVPKSHVRQLEARQALEAPIVDAEVVSGASGGGAA